MARASRLTLSLHGAVCGLESDHPPFIASARLYLESLFDFYTAGTPAQPGSATQQFDVLARLHWNATPPAEWRGRQTRQWGRRLLQLDQQILQTGMASLPGLQLASSWSAGTFKVEAYYRPSSRIEKLSLRFDLSRQRVFNILIYYLVYFPLIHYLEQTRGWYLAHVAALSHPQGGILLAGLPGGGKTTFSLGLLGGPQVQILSDNLILFSTGTVYALPEPVHLSLDSLDLLAQPVKDRLTGTSRRLSYRRRVYTLASEVRSREAQPNVLFFIGLSGEQAFRTVSNQVARERLLAFDEMAKEINAYSQFNAPLRLIMPNPAYEAQRQSTLEALVSGLDCYELWMEKGAGLEQACRLVDKALLEKVPQ